MSGGLPYYNALGASAHNWDKTTNTTLYAHWATNTYVVTFNANGGVGGWVRSMNYGTTISAPTVTRTGYTFTGWSPAVPSTVPAGNVTYTAQWRVNQYTVKYDGNGAQQG